MGKTLRSLHLIDKNRLTTGSVVQMLEAAKGLARRGHEVWIGSRPGGDLATACNEVGIPFLDLALRSPWDLASAARLRRHLRQHEARILHVHKGRAHGVGLLAASGLGKQPRLVINRGVSFPLDVFNKWKYRHPRVAAVVCVAEAVRSIVIQTGGLSPDHVRTVYGGTDPDVFGPDRSAGSLVRRELGLEPDHLVVGQVSIRDWKGWADLLEAFALVAPRWSSGRLLFVGCDLEAERVKIEEAARGFGIQDRVLMVGYRSDMPDVLAACNIVADASWAGTGITGTIREAMAMEKPVVATDCGGNCELVVGGGVGLLVPPRDIEALAAALNRLLEDPALRQRLGTAARKRVIDHFSTENRIDKLEELYREVLR